MLTTSKFKDQYEFRIVDSLTSDPEFHELLSQMGGPPPWEKILSDEEQISKKQFDELDKKRLKIRIGVYCNNKLIAFTYAYHTDGSNLHMALSCVHSDHQRKGIYTQLMKAVLDFSKNNGFQTVESHHRATNNPVIIAKLRQGFVINGFILSDIMGCLVRLTYYHNPERKKLMDVRSGIARPTERIKDLFF